MRNKHSQKLANLYGGPIPMEKQQDSYLNLSDIEVDTKMHEILSLGLTCHQKRSLTEINTESRLNLILKILKKRLDLIKFH